MARRKIAEYNGWTNWDTWNTYLWLSGDYDLYQEAKRARSPEDLRPLFDSTGNPDGVSLSEVNWQEVFDAFEEDREGTTASRRKTASRPISQIAAEIEATWPNVNYAAAPYLEAMHALNSISDNYFADSGKSIVAYFLSNARSWRGEDAKRIKAELKAMLKGASRTAARPYGTTASRRHAFDGFEENRPCGCPAEYHLADCPIMTGDPFPQSEDALWSQVQWEMDNDPEGYYEDIGPVRATRRHAFDDVNRVDVLPAGWHNVGQGSYFYEKDYPGGGTGYVSPGVGPADGMWAWSLRGVPGASTKDGVQQSRDMAMLWADREAGESLPVPLLANRRHAFAGTPVEEFDWAANGFEHRTLTCRNHPTAVYVTKDPYQRGLHFITPAEGMTGECSCPFSDLIVKE